jgi:predicted SAM-dependent methyltransferase
MKLNVGSGKILLKDFVNIDIDDGADMKCDVRKGLPYITDTIDYIYNEHFIEHLNWQEAGEFIQECYRCLKVGGILRIATPDLDSIVIKYLGDWDNQVWLGHPDYKFIKTRGMMLNVGMRNWGHQYLFNEEDLKLLFTLAGFKQVDRKEIDITLETRQDSKLILEAVK